MVEERDVVGTRNQIEVEFDVSKSRNERIVPDREKNENLLCYLLHIFV